MSYQEVQARHGDGTRRTPSPPRRAEGLVTSTEPFAKVLSGGNRELLRVIVEGAPGSRNELARVTGKGPSDLSPTLRRVAGYGLVCFEHSERGRVTKVMHDRVELGVPLTLPRSAS